MADRLKVKQTQSHSVSSLHGGREPIGVSSAAMALLTSALWGGTPVAISYSVDELPPIAVAAIRFAFAAVFMVFWCRWEGTGLRLRRGQVLPSLIAGVLLFLQICLFHVGIEKSNSSHASLFINTFVIWVALIGHFVTKTDRLTVWKAFGLALAVAGAALILTTTAVSETASVSMSSVNQSHVERHGLAVRQVDDASLTGDLIVLGSAVLLGVKIVYTKTALQTVEPGKLIFWHDLVGITLFAIFSAFFEEVRIDDFNGPVVWGLLYQGFIVAGFCFAVQTRLLRKHVASQLSAFSFTTPLFGILLAYLFRGDRLSPWLWVSGLCIAAGILLVNTPAKPNSAADIGG